MNSENSEMHVVILSFLNIFLCVLTLIALTKVCETYKEEINKNIHLLDKKMCFLLSKPEKECEWEKWNNSFHPEKQNETKH